MPIRTIIIAIITLAILAFLGLGIWQFGPSSDDAASENQSAEQVEPPVVGKGEVTELSGGDKRYVSTRYGFSFLVPGDFSVGEFDEGGGRVVLAQSGEGEQAFQVFITPWDEPASNLTPERIKQDLPNLEMQNVGALEMSGGPSSSSGQGNRAITFVSSDPSFGQTREVWFVQGGYLYQIMTYVGAQDFLGQVLETWQFQ